MVKRNIYFSVLIVGFLLAISLIVFASQNKPAKDTEITKNGIDLVIANLTVPWDIAVLPNNDLLITERPGQIKRLDSGKTYTVNGVVQTAEGGLLGITLHPKFIENNCLFLYLTTTENGKIINRVERYAYKNDELTERNVIINNIPGSDNHDGGRIAFGIDGKLYVTTGDAGNPANSQNIDSLAGKILRVNDNGSVPSDNPFNNLVYSYGHRNPQGIAWDNQGRLWSTEHGPSGTESGNDELNLIKKGGNYGWPIIKGSETRVGIETPVLESGTNETWAPAGLAFFDGYLFFSGLRGEALYRVKVDGQPRIVDTYFKREYGRIRAVVASGNFLYITTSNKDGRGHPKEDDDKILKISQQIIR